MTKGTWIRVALSLGGMVTLLALVIVMGSPADAQRLRRGGHTWTGISGFTGEVTDVVLPPEERDGHTYGRAVIGLRATFGPASGDGACGLFPCVREIGLRGEAPPSETPTVGHEEFPMLEGPHFVDGECGAATPPRLEQLPHEDVRVTSSYDYVTGISVCTQQGVDSAHATVRGIRLFTERYEGGGQLERTGAVEQMVTVGCEQWHTPQSCPDETVATGFRVHHGEGRVRGIGLRCTPLSSGQD